MQLLVASDTDQFHIQSSAEVAVPQSVEMGSH